MNTNYKKAEVLNVAYSLLDGKLKLSLKNYPYAMFVKPEEIHFVQAENPSAGQQKPSTLCSGSIIKFLYNGNESVREITNVILMSDGITEVDDDGKYVKW